MYSKQKLEVYSDSVPLKVVPASDKGEAMESPNPDTLPLLKKHTHL